MNNLPKIALPARGIAGAAVAKPVTKAPFPYVVLSGREDAFDVRETEQPKTAADNERTWFAAHVEVAAPRWGDAREALVRSLALPVANAAAPLQDDAAWDGGAVAAAPTSRADNPPIGANPPTPAPTAPVVKLRAKRRAPTLDLRPAGIDPLASSMPPFNAEKPHEDDLPLLREGLAPLIPIPGPSSNQATRPPFAPVVEFAGLTPPPLPPVRAQAQALARPTGGRFKKAVGIALLCGMLGAAGYMLFQDFKPSGSPAATAASASVADSPKPAAASSAAGAAAAIAPTAAVAPTATSGVPLAPAVPAGPVQASEAFRNFVVSLRVSGVSLGASPRALINGRMVHVGDLLEPTLGVRLVAVDGAERHLVFEDRSTARVQARY